MADDPNIHVADQAVDQTFGAARSSTEAARAALSQTTAQHGLAGQQALRSYFDSLATDQRAGGRAAVGDMSSRTRNGVASALASQLATTAATGYNRGLQRLESEQGRHSRGMGAISSAGDQYLGGLADVTGAFGEQQKARVQQAIASEIAKSNKAKQASYEDMRFNARTQAAATKQQAYANVEDAIGKATTKQELDNALRMKASLDGISDTEWTYKAADELYGAGSGTGLFGVYEANEADIQQDIRSQAQTAEIARRSQRFDQQQQLIAKAPNALRRLLPWRAAASGSNGAPKLGSNTQSLTQAVAEGTPTPVGGEFYAGPRNPLEELRDAWLGAPKAAGPNRVPLRPGETMTGEGYAGPRTPMDVVRDRLFGQPKVAAPVRRPAAQAPAMSSQGRSLNDTFNSSGARQRRQERYLDGMREGFAGAGSPPLSPEALAAAGALTNQAPGDVAKAFGMDPDANNPQAKDIRSAPVYQSAEENIGKIEEHFGNLNESAEEKLTFNDVVGTLSDPEDAADMGLPAPMDTRTARQFIRDYPELFPFLKSSYDPSANAYVQGG